MKTADVGPGRLNASGLVDRRFGSVAEVVAWHGAVQAQDYGPSSWSIAQRMQGLVQADVDAALDSGDIIRTHVMRPTWHFVARDDIRWLLKLTGPRIRKSIASRLRELGLDARTLSRAEQTINSVLEGGNRLTRDDIGAALNARLIDRSGQRLPHILMHCELEALICSGGLDGKQQTYALLDDRVPDGRRFEREEAVVELVRRYLRSHGPVAVHDLSWWSGLTATDVRTALGDLGDEVSSAPVEGELLWWLSGRQRSRATGGTLLLQQYDEVVVGYSRTRFFGDPREASARESWKERSRPTGVVLMKGAIEGHWRRTTTRTSVTVQVLRYSRQTPGQLRGLERAAEELGRFVGLPAQLEMLG